MFVYTCFMCLVLVRSQKLPTNVWAMENHWTNSMSRFKALRLGAGGTLAPNFYTMFQWCRQIGHRNVQQVARYLLSERSNGQAMTCRDVATTWLQIDDDDDDDDDDDEDDTRLVVSNVMIFHQELWHYHLQVFVPYETIWNHPCCMQTRPRICFFLMSWWTSLRT